MSSGPRHRGDERDHGSERWLVSYADFMTLMFAFFAVLYATSQKDVEKAQEFQQSIKRYLIKAGGISGGASPQIHQGQKNNSVIEAPIPTHAGKKIEGMELMDEAEVFIESELTATERKKYVLDLSSDDWGVRLVLPSRALFSDSGIKFRAEALPFLSKLGGLIGKAKRKVLIEGHVGPNEAGSFASTWDFAAARSTSVLRFLLKKEGLSPSTLAAVSMGDSRPITSGRDAEMNSRIEIVLLNPDFEM